MALIQCPECNNEISDQARKCKFCGYPIRKSKTSKHKFGKKFIIIVACIFLLIAISIFVGYSVYTNQQKAAEKTYADNLSKAIMTINSGTSDAEYVGDLVYNVWYNSIFDKYDDDTLKYMGTTFNKSLENLFSDADFEEKVYNLDTTKKSATHYIKLLSSPSEKYKEPYNDLKDYYASYVTLINLVSDPDGSLNSYTESYNDAKSDVESNYSPLEMYVN